MNGDHAVMSGVALVANRVDGLACCGRVGPTECLPPDMDELFDGPTNLFPGGVSDIPAVVSYTMGESVGILVTSVGAAED